MADPLEQARQELQSDDPAVRDRGVRRLGVTQGVEARDTLLRLMDHPEIAVRERAAHMLGHHHRSPQSLEVLLERLQHDPSRAVRAECVMAVEEFPPETWAPTVFAALSDPDDKVVGTACQVLAWAEVPGAEEAILNILERPSWNLRHSAAAALLHLDVTAPRLVDALRSLLADPVPEDRSRFPTLDHLQDALERLTAPPPDTEERDPEEAVFRQAETDLRHADPKTRRKAAERLRGFEGPRAAAALLPLLDDPSIPVRSSAALSLGLWAIPEALPRLGRLLLTDESHVRRICSAFMHYFPAADAVPHLLPALADPDPGVVSSCCVSLGLLGDPTAIPSLLGLLDHPDWNARLEACWALIKLKAADERIVAALEQLMREPEAVEYDLAMDEMNAMPDVWDETEGDEEPEPAPRLQDLLDQARALIG